MHRHWDDLRLAVEHARFRITLLRGCLDLGLASEFIDGVAWQVDLIVPIDACATLIQLDLLEQSGNLGQQPIAGQVEVCFDIIDNLPAIVKADGQKKIGQRNNGLDARNHSNHLFTAAGVTCKLSVCPTCLVGRFDAGPTIL